MKNLDTLLIIIIVDIIFKVESVQNTAKIVKVARVGKVEEVAKVVLVAEVQKVEEVATI